MNEKELNEQETNFLRGSENCGWCAEGKFSRRLCTAIVIKSQYGDKNGYCRKDDCAVMLEVVHTGKQIRKDEDD